MPALDWVRVRLFERPSITDTRKQIGGLAVLDEGQMAHSPFEESLFVCSDRERRIMKIRSWDESGCCVWQNQLALPYTSCPPLYGL